MNDPLAHLEIECIYLVASNLVASNGQYSPTSVQDRCLNKCTYSDVVCEFHKSIVVDLGSLIKQHATYATAYLTKQSNKNRKATHNCDRIKYIIKMYDFLLINRYRVLACPRVCQLQYDKLCEMYLKGGDRMGLDIKKYVNGLYYRYLIQNNIIKHNRELSDEINDIVDTYDLTTGKIKINIII